VTQMCASLIERGAPGLHFYTLNQAGLTVAIWRALGLGPDATFPARTT
jgi:methylenetetrahydrofolate reductase (NADPH)